MAAFASSSQLQRGGTLGWLPLTRSAEKCPIAWRRKRVPCSAAAPLPPALHCFHLLLHSRLPNRSLSLHLNFSQLPNALAASWQGNIFSTSLFHLQMRLKSRWKPNVSGVKQRFAAWFIVERGVQGTVKVNSLKPHRELKENICYRKEKIENTLFFSENNTRERVVVSNPGRSELAHYSGKSPARAEPPRSGSCALGRHGWQAAPTVLNTAHKSQPQSALTAVRWRLASGLLPAGSGWNN